MVAMFLSAGNWLKQSEIFYSAHISMAHAQPRLDTQEHESLDRYAMKRGGGGGAQAVFPSLPLSHTSLLRSKLRGKPR
jgi:hypothetical protein